MEDFDASAVLAQVVETAKESCKSGANHPIDAAIDGHSRRRSGALRECRLEPPYERRHVRQSQPIEVRLDFDASSIYLKVLDHGIGIAEADHERIFERFVKLDQGSQNVRFGIGLWVTRAVVLALDGESASLANPSGARHLS